MNLSFPAFPWNTGWKSQQNLPRTMWDSWLDLWPATALSWNQGCSICWVLRRGFHSLVPRFEDFNILEKSSEPTDCKSQKESRITGIPHVCPKPHPKEGKREPSSAQLSSKSQHSQYQSCHAHWKVLLGWLWQEEVCHKDFENFRFLLELHIERQALVFLPTQAQPSKLDRLLNRPSKGSLGGDESWDSSLTARVVLPKRQPHTTQGEDVIKAFLTKETWWPPSTNSHFLL